MVEMVYHLEYKDICVLDWSTAQESRDFTRWDSPPLRNCKISRAVTFHRSGIAESRALEWSIARESWNLTRWRGRPLGNRRISRARMVHRTGIVKFHAPEGIRA